MKNSRINTQKLFRSVAVLGAVTAAGTIATTTAHADTVADAASSQPAATTTADQQLANLKSQQAANEAQVASSNAATMSAASAAASQQIANTNTQIVDRQASDAAANQAAIASQTKKINSAAQSATNAENASYSAAVAKQSAANAEALKSAQANISTPAQKARETAQENAAHQRAVNNLESQHTANVNKINADYKGQERAASQKIAAAQSAAEQKLANATKQVDAQIAGTQQDAEKAQATVKNDQTIVTAKQAASQKAASAVKTAQQALTNDQANFAAAQKAMKDSQGAQVTNKVVVPAGYIDAWKKYTQVKAEGDWELSKDSYPDLFNTISKLDKEAFKANTYKSDPAAKQVKVVLNENGTLSRDDIVKATQFAVSLLNPLREAIGTNPYKITNASIDVAQDVANGYRKDKFNMWTESGHDNKLLSSVANAWGTDLVGESWAGGGSFGKTTYDGNTGKWIHDYSDLTLDDLYRGVYDAICSLLFNDADQSYGHTTDLLGVRTVRAGNYIVASDDLGVSFDYGKGDEGWGQVNVGGFHFDSISDATSPHVQGMVKKGFSDLKAAKPNSKVNQGDYKTEIAVPTPSDMQAKLQKQVDQLSAKVLADGNAVQAAKATAQEAANALQAAQAQLSQDQQAADAAQAKLDDLKTNRDKQIQELANNSSEAQLLQDQLKQLQAKHAEDIENENTDYANKLQALNKSHETKLAAIAAEPENVDALQTQLQGKLAALKTEHEAKLAAIQNEAQAKIAALQKQTPASDPEIGKLQEQIDVIKDNLAKQQQTLDAQLAALKAKDQAEYNALEQRLKGTSAEVVKGHNDHYNTSDGHEVVLPSSNKQDSSAIAMPSDAKATVAGNTEKPGYAVSQAAQTGVGTVAATTHEVVKQQAASGQELPQTGNKNGIVAMVLSTMAALFSLGFATKKRY
ncbi:MAG: SEC10/PgrA surface exclusion domain-containing protein [Limosilactobacillus sp.]